MAENTKISWATHTLNWWTGWEAISDACAHCYAHSWAKRAGRDFAERRLTTESNRRMPFKWQRNAAAFLAEHGHRQRVFVNSLSDWADNQVPHEWRASLFAMIRETPDLDYLLLTKRIGNALKMLPTDWGDGYPNVWLGATIANQAEADRDVPKLLATPARVRFLSCEPLLGPVNIGQYLWECCGNPTMPSCFDDVPQCCGCPDVRDQLHWVIAGGESGGKARPSHPDWFRSLRDQCAAAGVAFHFKQWGEFLPRRANEADPCLPDVPESKLYWSDGHKWSRFDGQRGGVEIVARVGKKASGRMLDGRVWDQFPEVSNG